MKLTTVPDGHPIEAKFKTTEKEANIRSTATPMRGVSIESRPNTSKKRRLIEHASSDVEDDELSRPDAFRLFKDQEKIINRVAASVEGLQQEMASVRDIVKGLGARQDRTTPRTFTADEDIGLLMENISQVSSKVGEVGALRLEVKMMQRRMKRMEDERRLSGEVKVVVDLVQSSHPNYQNASKTPNQETCNEGIASSQISYEARMPAQATSAQATSNDQDEQEHPFLLHGPEDAAIAVGTDVLVPSLDAVPKSKPSHQANVHSTYSAPSLSNLPTRASDSMPSPELPTDMEVKATEIDSPPILIDSQDVQTEQSPSQEINTSNIGSPPTIIDSQDVQSELPTIRETDTSNVDSQPTIINSTDIQDELPTSPEISTSEVGPPPSLLDDQELQAGLPTSLEAVMPERGSEPAVPDSQEEQTIGEDQS